MKYKQKIQLTQKAAYEKVSQEKNTSPKDDYTCFLELLQETSDMFNIIKYLPVVS